MFSLSPASSSRLKESHSDIIVDLTYKEDRVASSPQINKAENSFYTVYSLSISHPWIPCQPEFIHTLFGLPWKYISKFSSFRAEKDGISEAREPGSSSLPETGVYSP